MHDSVLGEHACGGAATTCSLHDTVVDGTGGSLHTAGGAKLLLERSQVKTALDLSGNSMTRLTESRISAAPDRPTPYIQAADAAIVLLENTPVDPEVHMSRHAGATRVPRHSAQDRALRGGSVAAQLGRTAAQQGHLRTPRIEWQFLEFKHNEHQMDSAREMAPALGVDLLRFRSPGIPYNRMGQVDLEENWMPTNPAYWDLHPGRLRSSYDRPAQC